MTRLLIIGLDCAPPSLVFERWADALPNLSALRARSLWGPLRSCAPPITVPAWAVMCSGRDPGELGLYGFRHLDGYDLRVARSTDVRAKRLWDHLGEHGKKVASLFVPLTSPPRPLRGLMVGDFLGAPGAPWVFPPGRASALEARFGPYLSDVASFRDGDLPRIFAELRFMAEQHFAMATHVWEADAPDFLMMVEMGPDRLHHACWHHIDPRHPRYVPGNRWEAEARSYYAALDAHIGALLERAGDAHVMVVSDHGARAMEGAVAINEWLAGEGWQRWRSEPKAPCALREVVDWSQTRAWGEGGYYARIFLNVAGREPEGCIPLPERDETREVLAEALATAFPGARIDRPERAYRAVRGAPPDLMVYFDDLARRSVGTVGHGAIHLEEAPGRFAGDGCNHDWEGIFMLAGEGIATGRIEPTLEDVAPTVLGLFGIDAGLPGRRMA